MEKVKNFAMFMFLSIVALMGLCFLGLMVYNAYSSISISDKRKEFDLEVLKQSVETEKQRTLYYEKQEEYYDKLIEGLSKN